MTYLRIYTATVPFSMSAERAPRRIGERRQRLVHGSGAGDGVGASEARSHMSKPIVAWHVGTSRGVLLPRQVRTMPCWCRSTKRV